MENQMPLLRFDLIEGRDEKSVTQLLDAAHDAVVKALGVPVRDRYQVVHQHPAHELIVQDTGLGIERSRNVVLITITSNRRSDELKQALYKALSEELERQCGIAPNDVMISLVSNTNSDWSVGFGEAQFLTGKLGG
jgi:phenylpyruvate tautomerase PptA (4-oxalocrotonate tautomerase family)